MVKNGRENEFKAFVALLRAQHIRKIRPTELLDLLKGGRIVDGWCICDGRKSKTFTGGIRDEAYFR